MQKQCNNCHNAFTKKVNCSLREWGLSKYCSKECRKNGETLNLIKRNKEKPTVESGTIRFKGISYSKEWCLQNPDKVKEFKEERKNKQKELRRIRSAEYLAQKLLNNPIILKTAEYKKQWQKEYRKRNKEKEYNRQQQDSYKFKHYVNSAKKRNYEFTLTVEEFTSIFHGSCNYCGKEESRGIDRVDNLIGYTTQNSKSCCEMCNKLKWKWSKDDFINQIKKISKHLQL